MIKHTVTCIGAVQTSGSERRASAWGFGAVQKHPWRRLGGDGLRTSMLDWGSGGRPISKRSRFGIGLGTEGDTHEPLRAGIYSADLYF